MTIEIRRLEPDDWALYREVRLAALRDSPFAFGSTLESESTYTEPVWRERLQGRALFVALHSSGRPAGLAGSTVQHASGLTNHQGPTSGDITAATVCGSSAKSFRSASA